jgi:6-pyruvoyltetrahydropterin/6-carboxytetrahydropterin synthase
MALIAFELLSEAFLKEFKGLIKPINVRLFETPNNWADAS